MPVALCYCLAEAAFRVVAVAEVVNPMGVQGMISCVLCVDGLEDVYFSTLRPAVGGRLRHHPEGREAPFMRSGL